MGELRRTTVGLRLFGDALDPDHVTRALGRTPDIAARRGEPWVTRKGTERVARTGTWIIHTPVRQPGSLDAQIQSLLGSLTDDLTVWRQLTADFRTDVFCGLFLADFNSGCEISPQTMSDLGSRHLTLSLDIYGAGGDPETTPTELPPG